MATLFATRWQVPTPNQAYAPTGMCSRNAA